MNISEIEPELRNRAARAVNSFMPGDLATALPHFPAIQTLDLVIAEMKTRAYGYTHFWVQEPSVCEKRREETAALAREGYN
jgi:hypothetical protein